MNCPRWHASAQIGLPSLARVSVARTGAIPLVIPCSDEAYPRNLPQEYASVEMYVLSGVYRKIVTGKLQI